MAVRVAGSFRGRRVTEGEMTAVVTRADGTVETYHQFGGGKWWQRILWRWFPRTRKSFAQRRAEREMREAKRLKAERDQWFKDTEKKD